MASSASTLHPNQKRKRFWRPRGGVTQERPRAGRWGHSSGASAQGQCVCVSASRHGTPRLGEEKLWKRPSKLGLQFWLRPGGGVTPGRSSHILSLGRPKRPHRGREDPRRCQTGAAPSSPLPLRSVSNLMGEGCGHPSPRGCPVTAKPVCSPPISLTLVEQRDTAGQRVPDSCDQVRPELMNK